ncbi:unnamed protein product [Brassicogethes aeneus]|uniref:Nose resistant-to-fluoxetine protein N-terminal domain-containing protein n=1 Tax=Brassicogethes aeneus TaxID=1431903 RepID=A0A9P0FHS6_BRAAE|nr:unnamed protein product [Brassicogethes aeneus]
MDFIDLVIDASGFIPSGMLQSNLYDIGNYDECFNILDEVDNQKLYGKYCLGTITLKYNNTQIPVRSGRCLPNFCTREDFSKVFSEVIFTDEFCYTKAEPKHFDDIDMLALEIFGFFAVLVILSTVYDLILYYLEKKPYHYALLAFSLLSNGRKILKTSSNTGQLSCINGIKSISCLWVIFGHVHSNILGTGLINPFDTNNFIHETKNIYILAAPISVDTFLALGGLLSVYTFMKTKVNVPIMYLLRILRLTPAYAIIILVQSSLIRYLGSGPFWGANEYTVQPCRQYWWSALLYIQNYVNPTSMCCLHTWYLSLDMQLFLVSPIISFPLVKWPKAGLIAIMCYIFLGFVSPFLVTYILDVPGSMITWSLDTYYTKYYFQPYTRFGPYVIGMLFGWIIYKHNKHGDFIQFPPKYKKSIIFTLWLIILSGLLACTYGGSDIITEKETGIWARTFYNGFNRNAWAILVCLMVTLCVTGYGGPANAFLSMPVFQILSKLSYSIYLVHFLVVLVRYMSKKVTMYFSETNVMYEFCGDFVITLLIAFFLCAIFEYPIICLCSNTIKHKYKKEITEIK